MARILGPDGMPYQRIRKETQGATVNPHPGQQLMPVVAWLKDEIDTHERIFDKFLRRGRKILKKYRDVRSPREDAVTRYNILWANVQTRLPALYARNPKPVAERRYKDRDPIGRTCAEILERSIEYTLEHCNDFFYTMRLVVQDYELPGLGMAWVRYEPHFHKPELPSEGDEDPDEDNKEQNEETRTEGESITSNADDEVDEENLTYEETKIDYVSWEDCGWSWARTWEEVRLIWKRAYLDRDELTERFGGKGGLTKEEILQIPLDWSPKNLTDTQIRITRKKAVVYEIHDKKLHKRYWLVKNFPKLLDERGDDLGLQKFFPCPRPLMANALSDELLPTPNFTFYQDQANEIDELSTRIVAISKALKVAGVRDTSAEGLDRLLSEGVENQLVPVEGWAVLKEKGGLKGVYELLPLTEIAEALNYLREQRTSLIEDIYQLTGIADIVRGFSDPDETATAQQMKGQFSMIRIQDAQAEVQRFCRDIIRMVGEIISQYDIETLKQISGIKLLTNAEKQQIQQQIALQQAMAAQQAAQSQPGVSGPPQGPPGGPQPNNGVAAQGQMNPAAAPAPQTPAAGQAPVSPDKLNLLELPTWEEVAALLENPVMREFRLDIETDSTVRMDEDAEKAARMELITAVGNFLDKAVMAGQQAPEIVPMLGELLMYGIRAFKTARPIEQAFEDAMDALEKASSQPKGPPPEVQLEMMKGQAQIQIAQQKAQLDAQVNQAKQQAEAHQNQVEQQLEDAREQHKMQLELQLETHKANLKAQTDMAVQEMKNQFEAQKVQYETHAKIQIAQMQHHAQIQGKQMDLEHQASQADRDREHQSHESKAQRDHERTMPRKEAA